MEIFSSSNHLESAFSSLEAVTTPSSKIFCDTLPNCPFIKNPKIGSLVMRAKEITADTGSDINPSTKLGNDTMGAVTAFSTALGILTLDKVYNSYKASDSMYDERGKTIAKFDASLRVTQIAGGGAAVLANFAPESLLASSVVALAIAGYSMDFLYLGLAAVSALSIKESNDFLSRLKKSEGNINELKTLLGELTGQGELELSKTLKDKDVYTHLGLTLRAMLNEIDPELAAKLSNRRLGKALFEAKYNKFLRPVLDRMNISTDAKDLDLETLKVNKELIRNVWAREKNFVFRRTLGFRGSLLLQRAKEIRLYEQLGDKKTKEYAEATTKELFQELKSCAKEQRHTSMAYFVAAVVGGFFSAVAWAIILPLETVLSKVGFLAFFLLMGYGDLCDFLEAYKSGVRAGEYAKFCSGTHLALGLLALSAFTVSTILTGGVFPVASLVIIGGVWITADVLMLILMHRRDKEYAEEHPSLKEFLDKLNSSNLEYLSKETLEMFHKLPKLQREAILRSLLQSNKEVMRVYAAKLKTFMDQDSLLDERLEVKGERLYRELQNEQVHIRKAFEEANKTLIGNSKPLDPETLTKHPSKHVFYRTFYNEVARAEQQKFCVTVGRKRLRNTVEKLMSASLTTKAQAQKIVELAPHNTLALRYV